MLVDIQSGQNNYIKYIKYIKFSIMGYTTLVLN